MFRKFTEKENELLHNLRQKGKVRKTRFNGLDRRVRYDPHDNFIVAVVKADKCIYTGVAKFNPNDTAFNAEIGQQVALARALMYGGGLQ